MVWGLGQGLTDSGAQASSHLLWAKAGLGWGKVKGECGGPAATTYLPPSSPGHLSHLCRCSQVEGSVLAEGLPHHPRGECHPGRCQASCNGDPGSALNENTRPLSASCEALLPSSLPAASDQLSSKQEAQSSIRVQAAETLGGREGVGERFGGKIQSCGESGCCPVCQGAWHLLPLWEEGFDPTLTDRAPTMCQAQAKELAGIRSDTINPCPHGAYSVGAINT